MAAVLQSRMSYRSIKAKYCTWALIIIHVTNYCKIPKPGSVFLKRRKSEKLCTPLFRSNKKKSNCRSRKTKAFSCVHLLLYCSVIVFSTSTQNFFCDGQTLILVILPAIRPVHIKYTVASRWWCREFIISTTCASSANSASDADEIGMINKSDVTPGRRNKLSTWMNRFVCWGQFLQEQVEEK